MIRVSVVLAVLAIAVPVSAHHGFGTFDISKSVSFPGATITKVELINPHSWLYFEVKDASGKLTRYRCEMRSAHVLRRSGWDRSLFREGQTADVTASPDRADANSCYLQTIVFVNGSRMDRYGQYVKAPLDRPLGGRDARRGHGRLLARRAERPVRHSDKLHVVERFTLDPKTMRLTREYEAEDPLYLKGKYTGRDVVEPADAPYAEDTCKEQKDVNYSKQVSQQGR